MVKGQSKAPDLVTRDYTINLHKRLHGITFKRKHVPRMKMNPPAYGSHHITALIALPRMIHCPPIMQCCTQILFRNMCILRAIMSRQHSVMMRVRELPAHMQT